VIKSGERTGGGGVSYLVGAENSTIAVCIVIVVMAIAATAAWLHFPKRQPRADQ